ncbi:tRNA (adenosine(37)-N6)-dimethylallyltransferase MiaA [Propionibacteriaceae bacterium Y1923]|uniref:tRNA (adenosine(37)-N6)-dimethylallyltransferase MiaA n=1 Tax=Aestuariimicrobium sp. Y1814 TaxID=3418742 RepID=UPI003C1F9305
MLLPIIQLVGPTASGKSGLAVDLALALAERGQPAEVVNADSMLVYRGMDIGTAKPSPAERRGVAHHLIDIMDVTETASVAQFQSLARAALDEVRGRGAVPILVGGSALYSRAITDVFEFPGTDEQTRARWEQALAERGARALHAELAARAPEAAVEILPDNGRRVVRALELLDLGQDLRPTLPTWTYALEGVHTIGLALDRQVMDERITQRVEQMWADGLVEEVRGLLEVGLARGRTASRAIGYRQVLQYLAGEFDEDEARAAVAAATRRFARKQLGWYRRDHRIDWRQAGTVEPAELAEHVLGLRQS